MTDPDHDDDPDPILGSTRTSGQRWEDNGGDDGRDDRVSREYRLLSGELTRMSDDGEPKKFVEGDIFRPTRSELDSFGDRLTRADDDSDASAHETGSGLVVTRRSYNIMSNYDGRDLRPQSRTGGWSGAAIGDATNASDPDPDPAVDLDTAHQRDLSDHPQSEDQQDLPEQPDPDRTPSILEQIFHPPKRSILSPGGPFHPATRGDPDNPDTGSDLSVDDGVEQIEALARDYADNDYEMSHHEYEESLDDILAQMDVGDAVEALERVKVDQIRV